MRAGDQRDLGNGGNGGQRFAAEAHGDNAREVIGRELAGGVTGEAEACILLLHSAAVVDDA